MDGWMDEWMDERMDGWMNGWVKDGQLLPDDNYINITFTNRHADTLKQLDNGIKIPPRYMYIYMHVYNLLMKTDALNILFINQWMEM